MRGVKPHLVVNNDAVTRAPAPPAWLSPEAKKEWRRVMPILIERRILTTADLGSLESYCTSIGAMRDAQRILNEEGLVIEGKRHPAFGIMNAAQTTARLCAAELGLTPVSRSRPAIREDDDADTLLD
ncbi:phage terminase small subunit P27 family [Blastochloris viridis]|uniref:phage terminase small subunit P27 family n=1 Tax=Blastochloris viridis TaxID=1079 RepID=UPI0006D74B3D|nr:phage terminase small subunit P27 family [Blastochloris viridis]ALK09505.1 Phage terminase, small subunit [Blastochloris viridis]